MAPCLRSKGQEAPSYGDGSDLFSLEVHHAGLFILIGKQKAYVNEKLDWFDDCDAETWSPLWIDDFLGQLGYDIGVSSQKVHWLLPGKEVADGLRVVCTDSDTNVMVSVIDRVKNLVIYVDHDGLLNGVNWDDIVMDPKAELPKVRMDTSTEKLSVFYNNLESRSEPNVEAEDVSEGSDTEDANFVDSEYEIADSDDDLFVNNVDVDVMDEGASTGMRTLKWKKAMGSRLKGDKYQHEDLFDDEELSTDDEGIQLPDSDGEEPNSKRFKPFIEEDLVNPSFKLGQTPDNNTILHCSWCKSTEHNATTCKLKKAGIKPTPDNNTPAAPYVIEVLDQADLEVEPELNTQVNEAIDLGSEEITQETMLSQFLSQPSQASSMNLQLHPLPTSCFIDSNQPAARPGPMTTATKKGRELMAKKGSIVVKNKDGTVKANKGAVNAKTKKIGGGGAH